MPELQGLQKRMPTTAENRFRLLEKIDGIKYNYCVYLSEPIDCNKELLRLPDADYEMSVSYTHLTLPTTSRV